jgi:hypothetical protein
MRITALLLILYFPFASWSQNGTPTDLIFLKGGHILRGKIVEKLPDGAIKMIEQGSQREVTVGKKEISKVVRNGGYADPLDYGSQTAIGISLLGSGFVGGHFRWRAGKALYLDFGVHYLPQVFNHDFEDEILFNNTFSVSGELDFSFRRFFNERSQKVRANGLFVQCSHVFGRFDSTDLSAGWSLEFFRLNRFKQSFLLNLGLGVQHYPWIDDLQNANYNKSYSRFLPDLHFRLQWNFHQ